MLPFMLWNVPLDAQGVSLFYFKSILRASMPVLYVLYSAAHCIYTCNYIEHNAIIVFEITDKP